MSTRRSVSALSAPKIGEHLVSRVPDVTRLVDRLETLGLAERIRDQGDRRVVFVRITRKGLAMLSKLDEPVLALHREQLRHMSPEQLGRLNQLLVMARERVGQAEGGSAGVEEAAHDQMVEAARRDQKQKG